MTRTESFYGTSEETYYVDAKGRTWLVQSPEMGGGIVAVSAEAPEGDEIRVEDESLQELAAKLDRLSSRDAGGALSARDLDSLEG